MRSLSTQAFESEAACYEFLQQLVDTGECEVFTITRAPTADASASS